VGASYGGYAALVGVTRTPDLYACAISYAGLSDLQKLIADDREFFGARSSTYKYLLKRIGDPVADKDQLEQTSPVNLADKIKVPVLLMHGDADANVPVEHSEMMNAAMLKAGKDVRFVRFKSEDHFMIEAATRTRVLQETEAFLFKAIGN
jgi:dipeptidyl aminopeptidase/acylaminoacyl peptidase